ncbi:LpqB family beta-propeller domain-containing protein [Pseudoalteromonas piscicida]|uniref:LpqB family beta-propeller domain-containing protein n=1 Tax=Pseudoalteromonas piscicida TaxID=43662 RepID=UPI0030A19A81
MQHGIPFQLLEIYVDPVGHSLSKDGQVCCVQPKFIEVLTLLAQEYPAVVPREKIIEQVWDGNLFVGEKALTNAIWHLRKTFKTLRSPAGEALLDDEQEIIETIRKSGYRLKAPPQPMSLVAQPERASESKKPLILASVFMLLFCVVGVILFSIEESPNYQATNVTDYPGRELFPSISPNEQFMAFSWRKIGSHSALYLKDLSQPDKPPVALTEGNKNASVSVWGDNRTLFFIEKSAGECAIKSLDIVTKTQSILSDCVSESTTTLTYSAEKNWLGYIAKHSVSGNSQVTLLNLNDNSKTSLTCQLECQGSEPESLAITPDATHIAISRNLPNGHENLYLQDLTTGNETVLLAGLDDLRGIAWHPTNPYLVVSSIAHGARTAYKVALNGDVLGTLPISGLSYPSFSPTGKLYFHNWNVKTSIMRLDLNGKIASSPFPLLQSQISFRYPNYSSVLQRLIFVSNQSGFDEVWMSSLKGDQRVQLTSLGLQALHPAWSPNGQQVVFTTKSLQGNQLQLLDVVTKNVTEVKTTFEYYGKPTWSQDGKYIYVSDGKDVFKIAASGDSEPVKVSSGSVAVEHQGALYVYKSDVREMWLVDVAKGEEVLLFDRAKLASSVSWSISGSGLYYLSVQNGDFRISYFDFERKAHKDIIRVPERSFSRSRGLAFIAEKQWLLFTGYEVPQVDIKRIEM